jgi:thioredoxin 1
MALYNITTKVEFENRVLNNSKLVLVDFWAEWCPPCRAMAPALHDIAEEQNDFIDIVKVNIEASQESQALATEYGVRSIPNMPLFKNGKEVDRIIGIVSKSHLVDMAKNYQKSS